MPLPDNAIEILRAESAKMRRLIDYRRPFDSQRAEFYRQYMGHRQPQMFPDGITQRANSYAKYPWNNVETIVSRVHDAFFSYDDWFEARGVGAQDGTAAEKMTLVLKKQLKKANVISCFEDIVRTIAIYGHGGMKVDWDWGFDWVNYMEPVLAKDEIGQPILQPNPQTGQPEPIILGMQPAVKQVSRNCPRFTPIDVYDLYVDPDGLTAAVVFDRTLGQLQAEMEGFRLANPTATEELYYPEALAELVTRLEKQKDPNAVIIRLAEIWDLTSNTVSILTAKDSESIAWKERRSAYRFASYESFRRPVYAGPEILLWSGYNQFAHKRIPILHTSYVRLPNEAYGIGAVEPIAEMTEAMSQMVNMIRDNWNLGINRRYAYDINADIDHNALNRFNTPGGKVAVDGDPSRVIMPLPTHTPERGDYSIIELYRNLIEMTSGISEFYSGGTGGPGGNSTATGISAIIGESNYKFRMFIRNLEVYIMQPLLTICASMVQQYLPDDIEVALTDEAAGIPKFMQVSPEELVGNFSYDLVAANYVTNEVVRQRNLLAWGNMAAQSPYLNQFEGLKALGKAFKIPNMERLLKSEEQVAQEEQQAMQMQMQQEAAMDDREHKQRLEEILLTGAVGAQRARTQAATRGGVSKSGGSGSSGTRGRPRTKQAEGQIPGADIDSLARELGSDGMGLRNLGTGKFG